MQINGTLIMEVTVRNKLCLSCPYTAHTALCHVLQ
jgi:hypothetical protein